ncbi:MAG: OmpH family outer membrane protein (Fragment) [uncultured Aureispira sp.]|uniref:OmpH family outer membrane protein n=1 Tax=uncultured Aureispira sp. TaxID=1331704 RepID=A0A6S6T1Y2_9BACT
MKDNYNIKTNSPELSSEQISKHQDFDALFAQFQAAEIPAKNETAESTRIRAIKKGNRRALLLKYGTGALMAVAASVLLVFMIRQSMSTGNFEVPLDQINERYALQSPMPNLQPPYGNLVVNAAENGETLNYESGSKIIVPASAFVDERGKPVKGKVDIQYREFNDHVDMFLAGVPKEMDKHQNLQSVGMMEIKGFQDGKPVYLSMDKTLEVELQGKVAADVPTSDLKVYVYGKQEDTWAYVSNDEVEVLTAETATTNGTAAKKTPIHPRAKDELIAEARKTLARSQPVRPIQPGVREDMQVFDFDINTEEFPELSAYNQDVQLMASASAMTAGIFDTAWNSVTLTGLGNNKYNMELVYETNEGNIVRTFEVYPAIEATREAEAFYLEKLKEYEIRMKQWETDVLVEVEHLSGQETIAENTKWKEIVNRFKINRFGLWNCGKEIELEQASKVKASFVDENGAAIAINRLFVTNKNKQLYYFAPNIEHKSTAELKYEATAENKIWALTDANELLVASNPSTKGDQLNFEMRSVGIIETEEDIRNVLMF